MNKLLGSFLVLLSMIAVAASPSAQAAVFTATLDGHLTNDITQTITGFGSFTVNGNEAFPALTNAAYVGPEVLSALNINIGGFNFTLADAANSAAIFYTLDGNPVGLDYYGNLCNGPPGRTSIIANLSVQYDTFSSV
jgi:hypothetical protein